MTVIETKNLTYKYSVGTPFEVTAVKDVSFTVEKGDFIGIIGHTGSGKSTLTRHLNGLLKQTGGEVWINGRDIRAKGVNIRDIRFEVGLVFQYSEHQLFEETVFKDISFGPKNMGLSEDGIKERVLRAAEYMGVHENWLSRSPFDLSGGQKRRVALAGVIAMEPRILILDEPAAGLDPRGREKVLKFISDYHKSAGITIILVSHSMEDIVRYAGKVLVMNDGGIFCYEKTDKAFSRVKEIAEIGLGVPQITRLAERLREKGVDLGTDVYTVERAVERILGLMRK
ncbi:MAG: energy-coupling factor transporter ATPase [Oscillospiraceae bacterium]|jgi:energy-coupling factor transport system ATP-binding protein|nr:energy-coupling factor transporter ATPase [Oscillospiraceae bacterium]